MSFKHTESVIDPYLDRMFVFLLPLPDLGGVGGKAAEF